MTPTEPTPPLVREPVEPGADLPPLTIAPQPVAGPALDLAVALRDQLDQLVLPLEVADVERVRALRSRIIAQLDTHLLPRLRQASLPTIAVVGGPTGAGKSTLVNAVAGAEVSPAGVVRPTTRRPVLVVNEADRELLADHPVLERADLVTADVPRGLALLDAPDLDSIEQENRTRALELVEVADVWLFVTTATRYGDAVPWQVLEQVRRRGITVGVVLDRVGPDALDTVRRDLLGRLTAAGFGSVPLFVVPDAGPLRGPLDPRHVAPVAQWLALVASRAGSKEIVARTVRGVWSPLRAEVRELVDAVAAQSETAADLTDAARAVVAPEVARLTALLNDGVLADGAPTTRWLAGASSRGVLEPLAHQVSGLFARRRATKSAGERTAALAALREDLAGAFADVVGLAAQRVDSAVAEAWREHSGAGAALVAARSEAEGARERAARVDAAWRSWLAAIEPAGSSDLLDAEGVRTLVAFAAAGGAGGRSALEYLGITGWEVARDHLSVLARTTLEAQGLERVAAVAQQVPADSATSLRVRVGELRRLAGED